MKPTTKLGPGCQKEPCSPSLTPETDAAIETVGLYRGDDLDTVDPDFARGLEIQRNNLRTALKRLDDHMIGNEVYECAWVNYPEKPEKSPSSYVREILQENVQGDGSPSQDSNEAPR